LGAELFHVDGEAQERAYKVAIKSSGCPRGACLLLPFWRLEF